MSWSLRSSSVKIAVYHNLASGGAKRACYEVISRLARKHSVSVYTLSTADLEFCDLRGKVEGHHIYSFSPQSLFESPFGRLNQFQRWRDLKELIRVGKRIAAQINREGFDVVYVHPCQFTQAPALLRHLRIPAVYHVHEPLRRVHEVQPRRPYDNDGLRKALDRVDPLLALYNQESVELDLEMTRSADLLLANSRFTANAIRQIHGRDAEVAYFGVDTNAFRPLIREKGREDFILSVGSINPHKGFDFLVESVARIPAGKRPGLRIVFNSGDEREKEYLRSLAKRSRVDLTMEGPITDGQLLRRYNQASAVVYTPHREPFGLVPIEAMSCGTPVIGVAEGGICETVIHGENGLLLKRDVDCFAVAIQRLLENDPLRVRLGHRARDFAVRNWSWEKSVAAIEEHLLSLTSPTRVSHSA